MLISRFSVFVLKILNCICDCNCIIQNCIIRYIIFHNVSCNTMSYMNHTKQFNIVTYDKMQHQIMIQYHLLYKIILYHIKVWYISYTLYNSVSFHSLPYRNTCIILYHIIRYKISSHNKIDFHFLQYRIIWFNEISNYFFKISYHMIQHICGFFFSRIFSKTTG